MTTPDPRAAELGDWRIANAIWVTAVDGIAEPSPRAAHQVTTFLSKRERASFVTPSAIALHLNSAWRFAKLAAEQKAETKWATATLSPGVLTKQARVEDIGSVFDYFELAMAATMSSFGAIEAFCNSAVIDLARGPIRVKRGKGFQEFSPETVEREIGTDEKLKRIVPTLMGKPTPAGKKVWGEYVELKRLRDAVTHFKRRDQSKHADLSHEPTALQSLWDADPFRHPEIAIAVIRYFHSQDTAPRWLSNPNWARPTNP